VSGWERYAWADEATESTVALVAGGPPSAVELLERLGPAEAQGDMSFDEALELQGTFYDDGSFEERAVVQVDRLAGEGGEWWATVEPNGFRPARRSRRSRPGGSRRRSTGTSTPS
jgi:hypothetical protein